MRLRVELASPVHTESVVNEDDVVCPARDSALRVLRAARYAGVRRVVLTSAFHAVGYGHPHRDHEFTESDWSVLDGLGVDAYGKSNHSPIALRGVSGRRGRCDGTRGDPSRRRDGSGSRTSTSVSGCNANWSESARTRPA